MDAALQDFLGNKPSMETPKPEPQSADTQEQASGVMQEKKSRSRYSSIFYLFRIRRNN